MQDLILAVEGEPSASDVPSANPLPLPASSISSSSKDSNDGGVGAVEKQEEGRGGPDHTELIIRMTDELAAAKDRLTQAETANRTLLHELALALEKSHESARVQDLSQQVKSLEEALADSTNDAPLKLVIAQTVERAARLESEVQSSREATKLAQRECERLASTSQAALSEKHKIEALLNAEQEARERAQVFQTQLSSRVQAEQSRSAKLEEDLDSLKVDRAKLLGSRDGLQQRLEQTRAQVDSERRLKRLAEEATAKAREETRVANEQLVQERRAAKELNARIVALQEDLSAGKRDVAKAEAKYEEASAARIQVDQRTGALSRQIQAQTAALAARDAEMHALQAKLESVTADLTQERKAHEARRTEVRAAAHDVATMTRENQAMHASLETLRKERDVARAQLHEATARAERLSGLLDQAKVRENRAAYAVERN